MVSAPLGAGVTEQGGFLRPIVEEPEELVGHDDAGGHGHGHH